MWPSDFTAKHYRSRAGYLERPRFDRNLTAAGCLPLSLPVSLRELEPYKNAVLSPPVPLCRLLAVMENDYESESRRFESCRAR